MPDHSTDIVAPPRPGAEAKKLWEAAVTHQEFSPDLKELLLDVLRRLAKLETPVGP